MAAFSYKALNEDGKQVTGVMEGDSERQGRAMLRSRNLKTLELLPTQKTLTGATGVRRWTRQGPGLSVAELSLFSRQLASLLQSGLPLDDALSICAKQNRRQAATALLSSIRSSILEGQTLAQAMSAYPAAFNRTYCAMIKAGEAAGYLSQVLERLATYAEGARQSRQKLQMALLYPLILLGVSILIVALLMVFVVPRLTAMFENSGSELPGLTRALIATSDFLGSAWAVSIPAAILLLIAAWRLLMSKESRRLSADRIFLEVPLLGHIIRQADSARFASTISILLNSGVPLVEALHIAGQVVDNAHLRAGVQRVAVKVREGGSFSKALGQEDGFSPLLIQMASSGEANGTLGTQMAYASENQERELTVLLGTFMALLEPLTILLMGGLVTLIMLAVLLPIFELNTLI
jgi:general secretion pathway protein F